MHVGIAYLRWRGKRSRHSRRMRTRNFAYLARGPWVMASQITANSLLNIAAKKIPKLRITSPVCMCDYICQQCGKHFRIMTSVSWFHRKCSRNIMWNDVLPRYSIVNRMRIDLIHKSQNAPVPYPTMLHWEQKCIHFYFLIHPDWFGFATWTFPRKETGDANDGRPSNEIWLIYWKSTWMVLVWW